MAESESQRVDERVHRWLRANSIMVLRVSLGVVFLAFGVLKYFPGVSPAEELSKTTMEALTFDLVPGHVAIVFVATLECAIGLLLIAGRLLRVTVYLLTAELVGILAPLALFPGRLFAGPHNAPTLEGQYVLKDIVLVAAGFVVASTVPGLLPGADAEESAEDAEAEPSDWTERSAVPAERG